MEIVRTRVYETGVKRLFKLGATEADVQAAEDAIASNPQAGVVVQGTGGLRKIRFSYGGGGKSGGGRTIYYVLLEDDIVYLLTTYAKVDKEDLTGSEKKLFKKLIKELTDG